MLPLKHYTIPLTGWLMRQGERPEEGGRDQLVSVRKLRNANRAISNGALRVATVVQES